MENEKQKLLEQEEVEELEEEEEVEETALFVRKSRTENASKTTEISATDFEVSEINSNGNIDHTKLVENGAENEEKTPSEEQVIEKLLEKEAEAINEEETPAAEQEIEKPNGVLEKAINGQQNLVFHDNVEGIWKCRLCPWTHRSGQNHKGQLHHHKLMNLKTFNFQSKGVDSKFTYLKEKQILKQPESKEFDETSSIDFAVQRNYTSTLNNGYDGEINNDSISNSIFRPSQVFKSSVSAEIESEVGELMNEEDLEATDLDVERVIQNQTTHDLFCPNCQSCITKRVILRKRKRRIQISDEVFKTKTARGPDLAQPDSDGVDNNADTTLADEDERDREGPAVFRCLSCFTFFIPSGNGFKCLPIKDWFASMFTPIKQETVVEQGSISYTVVQRGEASSNIGEEGGQPSLSQKPPRSPANVRVESIVNNHTWEGGDEISPLPNQKPSVHENVANGVEDLNRTVTIGTTIGVFDSYTKDQSKESKSSQHGNDLSVTTLPARTQVPNWKSVKDAIVFSQGGRKLPTNSTLEESDEVQTVHPGAKDTEAIHYSPTSNSASDVDGKFNFQVSIPHDSHDVTASITTDTVHEHNYANFDTVTGHIHHSEGSEHTITTTNFTISNEPPKIDDISVVTDGSVAPDTKITIPPSETPSVGELANQLSASDSARKEYEIEVVKSMVYGGLAESITSLSIVSSAAGGGAATLNVLAVGAANLIGGLFIICHNLWDLRYHQSEHVSNQINEQQDRYKELLGRRQSFILHAVIAIISYITFGLVPPLVYGFSFRKSDDRQLKLVVVGASSLLCILILAIAKAYTQRRPKPYLKTVATYVVLGFMVSGASYVAGELVERLLDELGLFTTSSSSAPNVKMKPTGYGWTSY